MATFTRDGPFIGVEDVSLDAYANDGEPDLIEAWKSAVGFRPGTVKVRRFMVPAEGVGSADRPEFYDDFL